MTARPSSGFARGRSPFSALTAGHRGHAPQRQPARLPVFPGGCQQGRRLPGSEARLHRLPDPARTGLADRHRLDRGACRCLVKNPMSDLAGRPRRRGAPLLTECSQAPVAGVAEVGCFGLRGVGADPRPTQIPGASPHGDAGRGEQENSGRGARRCSWYRWANSAPIRPRCSRTTSGLMTSTCEPQPASCSAIISGIAAASSIRTRRPSVSDRTVRSVPHRSRSGPTAWPSQWPGNGHCPASELTGDGMARPQP